MINRIDNTNSNPNNIIRIIPKTKNNSNNIQRREEIANENIDENMQ